MTNNTDARRTGASSASGGRQQRYRRWALLLAPLLLLAAACGDDDNTRALGEADEDAAPGEDRTSALPDTIKIGLVVDLTGPPGISGMGSGVADAADVAVEAVNESGVLGDSTVQLVKVDSKGTPDQAIAAMQRLIDDDGVSAIVGFNQTPSFFAAAPLAEKAGVPLMAVIVSAPDITQIGPHIFRSIYSLADVTVEFDQVFIEGMPDLKTAAYFGASDNESLVRAREARRAGAEKAGLETVAQETIAVTDTDFRTQLTKIKNADPDVLFVTVLPGQAPALALQMDELGLEMPIIGDAGLGARAVAEAAGSALDCALYASPWYPALESDRSADFVEAFEAATGQTPDPFNAVAHDAVLMVVTAIERAQSADRDAITEALTDLEDFEGVIGTYGLDEHREPTYEPHAIQVRGGEPLPWEPGTECQRGE